MTLHVAADYPPLPNMKENTKGHIDLLRSLPETSTRPWSPSHFQNWDLYTTQYFTHKVSLLAENCKRPLMWKNQSSAEIKPPPPLDYPRNTFVPIFAQSCVPQEPLWFCRTSQDSSCIWFWTQKFPSLFPLMLFIFEKLTLSESRL